MNIDEQTIEFWYSAPSANGSLGPARELENRSIASQFKLAPHPDANAARAAASVFKMISKSSKQNEKYEIAFKIVQNC